MSPKPYFSQIPFTPQVISFALQLQQIVSQTNRIALHQNHNTSFRNIWRKVWNIWRIVLSYFLQFCTVSISKNMAEFLFLFIGTEILFITILIVLIVRFRNIIEKKNRVIVRLLRERRRLINKLRTKNLLNYE